MEDAFGVEAPAEILDYESVAVLREFLHRRRHLRRKFIGDSVGCAAKQDGQTLQPVNGSENHSSQANSVAHGDHDFLKLEERLRFRLQRGLRRGDRDRKRERQNAKQF